MLPENKIETVFCGLCGKEHPRSEMGAIFGKLVCSHCLNAETFECSSCHVRSPRSEIATYDGDEIEICQICFDKHYTRCEGCGLLLRQPDANLLSVGGYYRPYCDGCCDERKHSQSKN